MNATNEHKRAQTLGLANFYRLIMDICKQEALGRILVSGIWRGLLTLLGVGTSGTNLAPMPTEVLWDNGFI